MGDEGLLLIARIGSGDVCREHLLRAPQHRFCSRGPIRTGRMANRVCPELRFLLFEQLWSPLGWDVDLVLATEPRGRHRERRAGRQTEDNATARYGVTARRQID